MYHEFLWDVSELIGELREEFPDWLIYVASASQHREVELDIVVAYMTDMMLSRFFECDSHITMDATNEVVMESTDAPPLGLSIPVVDFLVSNRYHRPGRSYDATFADWISSRIPQERLENSEFISLVAKPPCGLVLTIDIPES